MYWFVCIGPNAHGIYDLVNILNITIKHKEGKKNTEGVSDLKKLGTITSAHSKLFKTLSNLVPFSTSY